MNPRKDWSWRPDAETRKVLDIDTKKIKAAKRRSNEPVKPKTGESK